MAWTEDTTKRNRKVKLFVDDLDPRKKQAVITIHDQHFHDGNTWQPVDEAIADDASEPGYVASMVKARHGVKFGTAGQRRWIPRQEFPNEYVTFGRPQQWTGSAWSNINMGTMTRAGNVLTFTRPNYVFVFTATWRGIKCDYILKNNNAYKRVRFAATLTGLTWDGWRLIGQDGKEAGYIGDTTAHDATAIPILPNVPVTASNAGGYIEFTVDTTGKVFPVTVDPSPYSSQPDAAGGKDATMVGSTGPDTYNYGLATDFNSGGYGAGPTPMRSLVDFDTSSIPTTVTVDSATLSLWLNVAGNTYAAGAATVNLHQVLRLWVEGTRAGVLDDPATGCTWFRYDLTNTWATNGCGNTTTDREASVLGSHDMATTDAAASQHDFVLTPGAGGVQDWIDGTLANNGVIAVGLEQPTRLYSFCSSDNATAAQRPKLVIAYTEAGLTVADASHAHTADAVVLTQHNALTVADASHLHTAETPELTAGAKLLVVQDAYHAQVVTSTTGMDASHAHTAESPAVTVSFDLVVADASHAHTVDGVVLTQQNALTVADAEHLHTADSPALTQHYADLTVADTSHLHTAESLALVQHYADLAVADASHAHAVDGVVLTQHNALTVADAEQLHTADSPALAQHNALAVADATQLHTADSPALTQHNILAVADASQLHTADNVVVEAHEPGAVTLTVQDAEQLHTADSPALTQHNVLAVADATNAHTADAIVLTQHNALAVADAEHTHTVDALVVAQHNALAVADATHAHTVDALTLTQHNVLVVADASHAHTADAVSLAQHNILAVWDASQLLTSDSPALVQHGILALADATHAHTAEEPVLTFHAIPGIELVVQNAAHLHTAETPNLLVRAAATTTGALVWTVTTAETVATVALAETYSRVTMAETGATVALAETRSAITLAESLGAA